ncbi:TonB-dependent receptor [Pedomonas mirosovicensis]|uniref:TonB-dependent receptor n=1 Tax=Pedomonas mirosovicensis TaxID=2908641 RepID=UPI00216A4E3F|nr:TonB-dependent receptor [Pedomonas mirosovicensis]MCH8683971.1 TonB-dependent receptor [Pedomonas mirosovicensis]
MTINTRQTLKGLLLAGAASATLSAAPAMAQAQAPAPETASTQSAELSDIVVTARRRSESLQDVPVAVSAFSSEDLEMRGAADLTTLQYSAPNMTMQVARGSNSTLIAFIRGVGQQDPLWGFEPGVGLYVDDVYIARPQGAVLDIFDIERIEVLRGPQGTLYGRNTIGGAVKYVTKRLGNEPNFKARAAYGTYDQKELVISGDAPINDIISIGGAFAVYKRDGYGKNLFTGAEHYNKDVVAGRLSLEITPSDNLFIRIAADRTDDDSNPRHGHREVSGATPDSQVIDDVYDTRAGIGDKNEVITQGVSMLAEWTVSDAVTLKSITAYREGESDTDIDFDNTPAPTLDIPAFYKDDQFTQELQLLYTGDRLQAVAGLYFMDGTASGAFDTVLGGAGLTTLTAGSVDTKSYAAFADVSYDITDRLALSVGGRFTRDEKEGTVFRANYLGIRSPEFGNPDAIFLQQRTDYTRERAFEEFTPRLGLNYDFNDDVMGYVSYSRGFKSGGFDMRGDAVSTPHTVNGYDPEIVDSYEAGLKGSFLDRRLSLNFAAFYSDYKGQQVTTQVPVPGGTTIASFVDNVGSSRIWGLELEGRAVFTDAFSAAFALGYTDAKFKEFLFYDLASGQFVDVSDTRVFQNTPKWNGNLTLTYTRDLANGSNITLTQSTAYRSAYHMFEAADPNLDQKKFALIDLSLVWTSASDRWQVGVHGKNLTDKQYRIGGYNFPGALFNDSIIAFYGPPRTVTGTVEYRF